jgi:hypothetical protein
MSRRPTPWQRGPSARTSRGLVTKLIQASLVAGALALAVLVTFVPKAVGAATALPTISYTIDGIAGTNDWYRGSAGGNYVVVRWSVTGADNTDCTFAVKIAGPNPGTTLSCSASNAAGPVTAQTKLIKIDADPPTGVAATPSRAPDANGWYNHPLSLAWSGSDATSGIASCSSATYQGPDAAPVGLLGDCTDLAGNTSSTSFALQYDATPPQLSAVSVRSTDGANIVRWKSSSANDVAAISRVARGSRSERGLFDGPGAGFVDKKIQDGIEYHYAVRTFDQAGNASEARTVLALPKVIPLGKLGYTPRAAGPPILSWPTRHGASYYHVQLFRNGKRILAVWPQKTQLGLRARWRWAGRQYRLAPGQYAWFAWAGFGARAAARYKLLGHSTFIVPGA